KPGEEDCFLHGAVAAADHGNVLVAEEESVAGSAPGGTAARELLFTWNAELAVAGAGRDDHRASVEGLVAGLDHFRVGGEVHLGRSEERRVGKGCRQGLSAGVNKKRSVKIGDKHLCVRRC